MAKKRVKGGAGQERLAPLSRLAGGASPAATDDLLAGGPPPARPPVRVAAWPAELWLCIIAILLGGLLVFSNNLEGEFIFDDYPAIIDNQEIKSLLPFGALLRPAPNSSPLAARPLPTVSIALNYAFGGLEVRGYHIVNNLIHVLAALLLFATLRSTLLLPRFVGRFADSANRYALVVALLWMVHPLQTEAVNYISQRTETLMGLCYLATLSSAAMAFGAARPRPWYGAAVAACVLGMASKEVMVSAPLLVLLYDRLFVQGSFLAALRRRPGFYGALAASWGVIVFYQLNNPRGSSVLFDSAELTVLDYFQTQLTIVVHYLRLALWPYPLVLDSHDWPVARTLSSGVLLAAGLLGGLFGVTAWGVRRSAWWSFLGVWFFFILAPTSSLVPIVTELVAERRMYLPLAAVVVLVVFAVDQAWRRMQGRVEDGGGQLRYLRLGVSVLAVVCLGVISWKRNQDYRTEALIWADTVAKRPANPRAQENYGKALMKERRFAEAIAPLQESLRLTPKAQIDPELYSNLAMAFTELGRSSEAIAVYEKALALRPDDPLVHYNLGNAFLRVNDPAKAERSFRRAITLDPEFIPAKGNLGMLLLRRGDQAGAEEQFQAIRSLEPSNLRVYTMLADLRVEQGRIPEAVSLYREAVRLEPGSVETAQRLEALLTAHPEAAGSGRPQR